MQKRRCASQLRQHEYRDCTLALHARIWPWHEANLPGFYETPEDALYRMVNDHFETNHGAMAGSSSWAASLHLVLCYTKYIQTTSKTETVHVAVIDTHDLDDDVLVCHIPHLLRTGNHEYLSFDRIRGNIYCAVALKGLEKYGLKSNFIELKHPIDGMFGHSLRESMAPVAQTYGSHLPGI
jgi:hypothetical protein